MLRARLGHGFFPHAFLPSLAGVGGARRARLVVRGPRRARRRASPTCLVLAAIGLLGRRALRRCCCACCPNGPARREAAFEPIDPDLAVEP